MLHERGAPRQADIRSLRRRWRPPSDSAPGHSTDLGLFVSTTGGERWMVENTGFAAVVTEWLSVAEVGGRRVLFAFTHGRGAWKVDIR